MNPPSPDTVDLGGPPPLDRRQFPIAETATYLNHALVGPLPRVAVQAMASDADTMSRKVSLAADDRGDRMAAVRQRAAGLLGVATDDVAFVKNTTEGLAFVANGLDWSAGDRVVVPSREFPSTEFPWMALADRGVEIVRVEPRGPGGRIDLDDIARAMDQGRVRVIALSWVQFTRGWRSDLAAVADLAHHHGALLCADVIQGLGVLPCDLAAWGVDVAMADAHKWLLGPEGIGVMAIRPDARERLRVSEPGWASIVDPHGSDHPPLVLVDSAQRFEGGTHNIAGIMAMGASMDLLAEAGIDRVWAWVDALCDRLAAGLEDLGATVLSDRAGAGSSAIVSVAMPGQVDPAAVADHLAGAGVIVKARSGGVRFGPHGWNTAAEVDRAVTAVAHAIQELG